MFICLKCGKVFDEDEVKVWEEYRGEYWGMDAYETMSGCPSCEGSYEEAEQCTECGEYFFLFDLDENHLCENCREDTDEEE